MVKWSAVISRFLTIAVLQSALLFFFFSLFSFLYQPLSRPGAFCGLDGPCTAKAISLLDFLNRNFKTFSLFLNF